MTFHLWNERLIFTSEEIPALEEVSNSRIVFSYFFLISVVMKPWDCRDLLCFMHLLKLLFVSLILTCLYPYVWP